MSERAAGGLEALQELWRSNAANVWTDAGNKPNEPTIRATSWNRAVQATLERAAEALAPHIAAEREMREKLQAILDDAKGGNSNWAVVRLAAILGGKGE